MKQLMENWRRYVKEGSQWGGFTGGAAPLDEPTPDSGPIPPEQLRKMWGIYTEMGMSPEEILQTPEFVEAGIVSPEQLQEAITLDIEIGDIVLGGKYKNKRIEVKEIGTDDIGQPTINGKSLLKFRIEKQLPDNKKSKKTLDIERDKGGKES
jgi:hypothetical protein